MLEFAQSPEAPGKAPEDAVLSQVSAGSNGSGSGTDVAAYFTALSGGHGQQEDPYMDAPGTDDFRDTFGDGSQASLKFSATDLAFLSLQPEKATGV